MLTLVREISGLEDRVLIWLNQFMLRWPAFDLFVAWLLTANLFKFGLIVLVICGLWFAKSARQEADRKLLIEAVITGAAALFVARILALALPYRLRPAVRPELNLVEAVEFGSRTWSAFPSDHAVLGFALAAALYRVSPLAGLWAGFHAAVVICLPRLYYGLHHPSDLIGGALIGVAMVIAAAHWPGRHAWTGRLIGLERARPGMFYAAGFLVLFEFAEMFDGFRALAVNAFRGLRQLAA